MADGYNRGSLPPPAYDDLYPDPHNPATEVPNPPDYTAPGPQGLVVPSAPGAQDLPAYRAPGPEDLIVPSAPEPQEPSVPEAQEPSVPEAQEPSAPEAQDQPAYTAPNPQDPVEPSAPQDLPVYSAEMGAWGGEAVNDNAANDTWERLADFCQTEEEQLRQEKQSPERGNSGRPERPESPSAPPQTDADRAEISDRRTLHPYELPRPSPLTYPLIVPLNQTLSPWHLPLAGYYSDVAVRRLEGSILLRNYQPNPPLMYKITELKLGGPERGQGYERGVVIQSAMPPTNNKSYYDKGNEGICLDTNRDYIITTAPQALMVIHRNKLIAVIDKDDDHAFTHVHLRGVAYDHLNDLVAVTDARRNSVLLVNHVDRRVVSQFGSDELSQPSALAFMYTSRLTYLVVSDTGNHCVKVFTLGGRLVRVYGRQGSGRGELKEPLGVCVDPQGRLLVADKGNKRVVCYWTEGERDFCQCVLEAWDLGGESPEKVDMCAPSNLLIVITHNHKQIWPSQSQHTLRTYSGLAELMRAHPDSQLHHRRQEEPLEGASGGARENDVNEYRETEKRVQKLRALPTPGYYLHRVCLYEQDTDIIDMCFGVSEFYVSILPHDVKCEGYSLVAYKLEGEQFISKPKFHASETKRRQEGAPDLKETRDAYKVDMHTNHVCFDEERGRVCVALRRSLLILRGNYKVKQTVDGKAIAPYHFEYLKGVAFSRAASLYALTDVAQSCLFLLNAESCRVANKITHENLLRPYGVTFRTTAGTTRGAGTTVLVTDHGDHRVKEFAVTGVQVASYGEYGPGDGQLTQPCGVVADHGSGKILVADYGNRRVVCYWTERDSGGGRPCWQCVVDADRLGGENPKALALRTCGDAEAWLAVSTEVTTHGARAHVAMSKLHVFCGLGLVLNPGSTHLLPPTYKTSKFRTLGLGAP